MINPNSNNQQQSLGESCSQKISELWAKVTFFSRFVFWAALGIYISTWLLTIALFLINIPALVIKGQVWRLITAPFVHTSFLSIFFSFIVFFPTAISREKRIGTLKYAFMFLANSVFIQLVFVAACCLITLTITNAMGNVSSSLFPIFMMELVIECNIDPERPRLFFFIPIYFKSKLYPWILAAFFLLLSGFNIMAMLIFFCGMAVGYLHVFKLLNWLEISDAKAKRLENGAIISKLKGYTGYISVDSAAEYSNSLGDYLPQFIRDNRNSSWNNQQSTGSNARNVGAPVQNVNPFSGTGVTLGGTDVRTLQTSAQSGPLTKNSKLLQKPPVNYNEETKDDDLVTLDDSKDTKQEKVPGDPKDKQKYVKLVDVSGDDDLEAK